MALWLDSRRMFGAEYNARGYKRGEITNRLRLHYARRIENRMAKT